jgi:hypothetical protein
MEGLRNEELLSKLATNYKPEGFCGLRKSQQSNAG